MYKRVKKAKLGRKMAHRNSLRQNLLISLLQRGQVETTSPKAKILKSDMSSLLEEGKTKSEDLNFKKKIHNTLGNSELIKKFSEYVKSEKVGVTIVKIGFRAGDNAEKSRV
ncbi:MAG TPA: L17 family ribosomal protein, partial [Candidatus Dojkabacteria bacterium]|nr:L17 family ribosomal protein [Candidatus Dojkabacteria bacterium]